MYRKPCQFFLGYNFHPGWKEKNTSQHCCHFYFGGDLFFFGGGCFFAKKNRFILFVPKTESSKKCGEIDLESELFYSRQPAKSWAGSAKVIKVHEVDGGP